jgi:hypothetical protein
MNNDNQHLDFLISQHVDGCLDAAGKKSVEQRLMTDPDARKLYQEHRDVQDVLDDWGSRIPMINWDEFDQKLAARLEKETVGVETEKGRWVRKWYKPVAAAAALFVAASLGYGWHGVSGRTNGGAGGGSPQVASVEQPVKSVTVEGGQSGRASLQHVTFPDSTVDLGNQNSVASGNVTVTAPGDVAAAESLKDAVMSGLSNVADGTAMRYTLPASASAMNGFEQKRAEEDRGVDREGMAPLP